MLNKEIDRGFLWTNQLVKELEKYDRNRDKYPTLNSFMPEIVKFFDKIAGNISEIEKEVDNRRPKVVQIKPFENGNQTVSYSVKKIEIIFDKPLNGYGHSISEGNMGDKAFPDIGEVTYSEDKKSVFLEVVLKPNKEYQFILAGMNFRSQQGWEIKDYEVTFRTTKE
jgi:hypothetical protein